MGACVCVHVCVRVCMFGLVCECWGFGQIGLHCESMTEELVDGLL